MVPGPIEVVRTTVRVVGVCFIVGICRVDPVFAVSSNIFFLSLILEVATTGAEFRCVEACWVALWIADTTLSKEVLWPIPAKPWMVALAIGLKRPAKLFLGLVTSVAVRGDVKLSPDSVLSSTVVRSTGASEGFTVVATDFAAVSMVVLSSMTTGCEGA